MPATDQLYDGGNKRVWMDLIQYVLVPFCWMISRFVLILGSFCSLIADAISRFIGEWWLPSIIQWAYQNIYVLVFVLVLLLGTASLLLRGSGIRTGWVRVNAVWRWAIIIYLFLAMFGAGQAYATIEQYVAEIPRTVVTGMGAPTLPTTVSITVGGTRYAPFDTADPAVAAAQRVMTPLQDVNADGAYQPVEVVLSMWRATPADVFGGVPGVTVETPDGPVAFEWMPPAFQTLFFGDDPLPWYESDFVTDPNGAAKREDALGVAGRGFWQALTGLAGAIGASLEGVVLLMLTLGTFLALVMVALTAPLAMLGHNALWVGGFVKGAIAMILSRIVLQTTLLLFVRVFYGTVAQPGLATSYVLAGIFLVLYAVITWLFFRWARSIYGKMIAPVRTVVGAMRGGTATTQDTRTVEEREAAQQAMGFADTKPEASSGARWRAGMTAVSAASTGHTVATGGTSGALPGIGIAGLVRDDLAEIARTRSRPTTPPIGGGTTTQLPALHPGITTIGTAAQAGRRPLPAAIQAAVDTGGNAATVADASATPLGHHTATAGQYVRWAQQHGVSGADAAALIRTPDHADAAPALTHVPAEQRATGLALARTLAQVDAASVVPPPTPVATPAPVAQRPMPPVSGQIRAGDAPNGDQSARASAPLAMPAVMADGPAPLPTTTVVSSLPPTVVASPTPRAAAAAALDADGAPGAGVAPAQPAAAAAPDAGPSSVPTDAAPVIIAATSAPPTASSAAVPATVAPTPASTPAPTAVPAVTARSARPGAADAARGVQPARPAQAGGGPRPVEASDHPHLAPDQAGASKAAEMIPPEPPTLVERIERGAAAFDTQLTESVEQGGLAIEHAAVDAVEVVGTEVENVPPRIDQAAEHADVAVSAAMGVQRTAAPIPADRTFVDAPRRTLEDVRPGGDTAAPAARPAPDQPRELQQTRLRPRPAPLADDPATPTALPPAPSSAPRRATTPPTKKAGDR